MPLPSSPLPPKWVMQVSTTLVALETSVELDVPPMWTPQLSLAETRSVMIPFPEPGTKPRDHVSAVISPSSHLSAYVEIRDESLEEEGKPAGLARQGTLLTSWASYVL